MVREDMGSAGPKGPEAAMFLAAFHQKLAQLTEVGKLKYPPIRLGFIRDNAHLAIGIGQQGVATTILKEAKDYTQQVLQAIKRGEWEGKSSLKQQYWEEYLKDIETLEKMLGFFTGISSMSPEAWEKLETKELSELGGSFDYCIRDIVTIDKIIQGEKVRNTHIDSPWELNLLQEPGYIKHSDTPERWVQYLLPDYERRFENLMSRFFSLRKDGKLGTPEEIDILKEKYELEKEIFQAKLKDILAR